MKTQHARSALLVTNATASVLKYIDGPTNRAVSYNPFGFQVPDSAAHSLGFNGEERDRRLKGYLLGSGYRIYSPWLSRFCSPDDWSPFGEGGINAYAYCAGDPVNYTDPDGHKFFNILKFLRIIPKTGATAAAKKAAKAAKLTNLSTVSTGLKGSVTEVSGSTAASSASQSKNIIASGAPASSRSFTSVASNKKLTKPLTQKELKSMGPIKRAEHIANNPDLYPKYSNNQPQIKAKVSRHNDENLAYSNPDFLGTSAYERSQGISPRIKTIRNADYA